jgi:hypothetical protein
VSERELIMPTYRQVIAQIEVEDFPGSQRKYLPNILPSVI